MQLLGLKFAGKPAGDDVLVTDLNLKPNFKVMLKGYATNCRRSPFPPHRTLVRC